MNENYKKVSADTTLQQLSQWLKEGRLYVAPSSDELIDRAVNEILQRVCRIDEYCTRCNGGSMVNAWKHILGIRSIRRNLLLKKGKRKNTPNWYYVASIVNYLLIKRIYNGTLRGLTKEMHQCDTSYDNNVTRDSYILSDMEEQQISEVLRSFFES